MQPEKPWWYNRCTHNTHELDICWVVFKEAEGVVILRMVCMSRWHITIEIDGVGSVCRELTDEQFQGMSEMDTLRYIQKERQGLRNLTATPWNQE